MILVKGELVRANVPGTAREDGRIPVMVKVLDPETGVLHSVEYWDEAAAAAAVGEAKPRQAIELPVTLRGYKDRVYLRGFSARASAELQAAG